MHRRRSRRRRCGRSARRRSLDVERRRFVNTATLDGDALKRLALLPRVAELLESVNDIVPFDDLSERHVTIIELRLRVEREHELRAVATRLAAAVVVHRQHPWTAVLEIEIFIIKVRAVNALPPGQRVRQQVCEIEEIRVLGVVNHLVQLRKVPARSNSTDTP